VVIVKNDRDVDSQARTEGRLVREELP
jgi:hypothetical protein